MSAFDIQASLDRAGRRLGATGARASGRRSRSDRGVSRILPDTLAIVREATSGYNRPPMADLRKEIAGLSQRAGLRPPSRATVYKLLAALPTPTHRVAGLPAAVRTALYNLGPDSDVPAHQVAFYCFNYGDLAAISFASGLPWLALYQAARMRGHRDRSRGLLEAVAHARGI